MQLLTVVAAGAVACAVAVTGCTDTSSHGNRAATPTVAQSSTPAKAKAVDPFAALPRFRLATSPTPHRFVAERLGRIALYDADNGEYLYDLTDSTSDVLGSVVGDRVWYLHQSRSGCGRSSGRSVPMNGGPSRTELRPDGERELGGFAVNRVGTLAYVSTSCGGGSPSTVLAVRRPAAPESRIDLGRGIDARGVSVGSRNVAFIVRRSVGPDSGTLYAVPLGALHPGANTLSVAMAAPKPGRGCLWRTTFWTELGLLGIRDCPRRWGGGVFRFDVESVQPVARGPRWSSDLDAVASDRAGHLLFDEDFVVSYTASGSRRIRRGRCPEPDTRLARCPERATW
jgi:hypothetical protein